MNGVDTSVSDERIQGFIDSVIDDFEGSTGWSPFLSVERSDRIIQVDENLSGNGILYLDNGVKSGNISVYSGYQEVPLEEGTLLVENKDYKVLTGSERNQIKFYNDISGTLLINTYWGYDTVVPHKAKEAVKGKILKTYLLKSGSHLGLISKIEQETVKLTFNSNNNLLDEYEKEYIESIEFYLRKTP